MSDTAALVVDGAGPRWFIPVVEAPTAPKGPRRPSLLAKLIAPFKAQNKVPKRPQTETRKEVEVKKEERPKSPSLLSKLLAPFKEPKVVTPKSPKKVTQKKKEERPKSPSLLSKLLAPFKDSRRDKKNNGKGADLL